MLGPGAEACGVRLAVTAHVARGDHVVVLRPGVVGVLADGRVDVSVPVLITGVCEKIVDTSAKKTWVSSPTRTHGFDRR